MHLTQKYERLKKHTSMPYPVWQERDSEIVWQLRVKFQIRRHFEVKESYTATLARIGQRTWKMHSEKFVYVRRRKAKLDAKSVFNREIENWAASGRCKRLGIEKIGSQHVGNEYSRFYRLCSNNNEIFNFVKKKWFKYTTWRS